MFYYLEGTVVLIGQNLAVIDINGAGYACKVTSNTLARLTTGAKARLYIYSYIKEDAFDLYGFYDISEKRSFEQLLSISGVGPKAALSILSSATPETLAMGIINEDETVLTIASGVGKKLAQRIILELKDKVSKEMPALTPSSSITSTDRSGQPGATAQNAAAALSVLGYTQSEINAALRTIDVNNLTTEEIIRRVLSGAL